MNNAVYGKTRDNLKKRVKVRLINNAKCYKKYVSKPILFRRRYLVKLLLPFMKLNQF